MPICCLGLFCPCVLWGQNAAFGMGDFDKVLANPAIGCAIYFFGSCFAQLVLGTPVSCCFGMITRQPVRSIDNDD